MKRSHHDSNNDLAIRGATRRPQVSASEALGPLDAHIRASTRSPRYTTGLLTLLCTTLSMVSARGQALPPAEGPVLGPSRTPFSLQADLGLSSGFSQNLAQGDAATMDGIRPWVAVEPSLRLGSPNSRFVRWWASVSACIGVTDEAAASVNDVSQIAADFRLSLAPTSPVTTNISQQISRLPYSADIAVVGFDAATLSRSMIELRTGTNTHEAHIGYDAEVLRHSYLTAADRNQHRFSGGYAFRFATHAEFFLSSSVELVDWPTSEPLQTPASPLFVRATAGVEGFMTRHFWGHLSLGYVQVLNNPQAPLVSGIGELSFGWDTATTSLSLGLRRQLETSYWGAFVANNSAFLQLSTLVGERHAVGHVRLLVQADYGIRVHGRYVPSNTTIAGVSDYTGPLTYFASHPVRQGQLLRGTLDLSVSVLPYLAVTMRYAGAALISNFRTQRLTLSSTVNATALTLWTWQSHIGQLGLRLYY